MCEPPYVTWLTHTWHDSFIYDTTQSYVTRLIHMSDNSLITDVWNASYICYTTHKLVTRLIHTCPYARSWRRDTTMSAAMAACMCALLDNCVLPPSPPTQLPPCACDNCISKSVYVERIIVRGRGGGERVEDMVSRRQRLAYGQVCMSRVTSSWVV